MSEATARQRDTGTGLLDRLVFRESPYFDLIVMRFIVVGFMLFALYSFTFSSLQNMLTLPTELYGPLPVLKVMLFPLGWGALPPIWLVWGIFWVTVLCGVTSLIGLRTNTSLLAFAVGNIFLQAFVYSFSDIHNREAVMMIAMLALAFSPCGRYASMDSRMGQGFNRWVDSDRATLTHSRFAGWPITLIGCFFALMYLSAVCSKLGASGLEWANGYTLQYHLINDGLRWDSPLALWLSQFHYFLLVVQVIILVFQATFWLIIPFPQLKWIYVPLGLAFHIGIYLTLKAPFWHWIVLYSVFVPWSNLRGVVNGERVARRLFVE